MRVLVAGCGYVGTELGLRLAADGHEVWGLRRTPADLPRPIRPLAADLTVPATLANFRGEILLEAERVARERAGATVVVRSSGIYGPGRDRLLGRAARGRLEGGDRWTNRIHRDDLAEAVRHALGRSTPSPLYLASDREPARLREVLAWLATAIGAPWESAADAREKIPGKCCVPRRLLDEGFAFEFPTWREGYRSVIGSNSRKRPADQHIPDRPAFTSTVTTAGGSFLDES